MATRAVPERLPHQPALDGLRALAVAAVLVYHQNFERGWGRGGFLGVDVFFVLSGFLITSLLLIDHAHRGRVVSLRFWARRARRLFPALLLLLAITAAYAAFVARPYELRSIRTSALTTLLYVNNYWMVGISHQTGRIPPGPLVLGHMWSLSIEEQFYVLWPLLLALLVRVTRGRTALLLVVLGALIAASAGLMSARYTAADPWVAYFDTETRAFSLLVGAALGIAMLGWGGPVRYGARVALEGAGLAALALLVFLVGGLGFYTSHWLYHGGFLLVAFASAALIAAAVQSSSPLLRRMLSLRPLVAVGVISYGLYLYHLPIYAWLTADRVNIDGSALLALRVAVTAAVAAASYLLVERPIRRGALSWRRLRVVAPAACASVVMLVLVATLGSEPTPASALATLFYSKLALSTPEGSLRVLVAGDSLAFSLGQTVGGSFTGDGIVGATTSVLGCGVGSGSVIVGTSVRAQPDCRDWPSAYENAVESFRPDVSVLMVGSTDVGDRVVDGKTLRVGTPGFASYLKRQLGQATKILAANRTPLLLLTSPCSDPPKGAASSLEQDRRRVAAVNSVLRDFAVEHAPSVQIGDYADFMCPAGVPRARVNGQPARSSGILTEAGAIATWRWLVRTPVITQRVRSK